MKWIEILRKDDYALLQSESDTQYAVVSGYDPTQPENQQWSHGTYFTYFQNNPKKMLYLQSAYDCFMEKVNADYIPRCRLEELTTLFKDGLISDDRESAMEYFDEVCEMTEEEKVNYGTYKIGKFTQKFIDEFERVKDENESLKDYLVGCIESDEDLVKLGYHENEKFINDVIEEYESNLKYVEDGYSEIDAKDDAIETVSKRWLKEI